MAGEEVSYWAKGSQTTVYAASTWAERRQGRICCSGSRWDMGLAVSSDTNQTHLPSPIDQKTLAAPLSGKGESRALCPVNAQRYVAGKQSRAGIRSQSASSAQEGKRGV